MITTNVTITAGAGYTNVGTTAKRTIIENSNPTRNLEYLLSDTTPSETLAGHLLYARGDNIGAFYDESPAGSKLYVRNTNPGNVVLVVTE